MDYKFVASRHLKSLLNDFEQKQKRDIFDYTGGHLNASHLRQPATILAQQRGWNSSDTPLYHENSTKKSQTSKQSRKQNEMNDVLYQFSAGTSCSVPNLIPIPKDKSPPKLLFLREKQSKNADSEKNRKKRGYIQDSVFIEELNNQEMYMPSPRNSRCNTERSNEVLSPDQTKNTKSPLLPPRHNAKPSFKQTFLPVQIAGITKQDQYKAFKMFECDVLRKQDSSEVKVLSGNQAAVYHDNKLKQELEAVKIHGPGPNFHKLQVHMNSFEDVIENSPVFRMVLHDIKTSYDTYVDKLLDTQTAKHQVLRDQIEQMTASGTSKPKELEQVKYKVEDMEIEGKWLLDENERLRANLREETDLLLSAPEQEPAPKKIQLYHDEPPAELAEELEHYKALILEKLDALTSLHTALRNDHVPLNVCTHLEQCIKETEVEVQKLLKQNEYFEKSITDMEQDLKEAIVDADTNEKDARRIWRKVNSTRAQPGEDDEDAGKWNWYIS